MKTRGFMSVEMVIGLGVLLITGLLTTWALWERSGRLECQVARVQIADAYNVLAEKVKQQNAAVGDLARQGAAARKAGAEARAKAEADAQAHAAEVAALRLATASPTPGDGTCATAWGMIREALKGPPK